MGKVTYKRSRRPGCLTIVLLLMVVGLGLLWVHDRMGGQLLSGARSDASEKRHFGKDAFPPLTETWSEGRGDTKVVRIPLQGLLLLDRKPGLFGGASPADMARRSIRRATMDSDVRAIILEIDSGGGGITASDILHQELLRFKKAQPNRKIVTLCGDITASGAYYVAAAADHILAHPTSLTGSLGVMIQTLNMQQLGELLGVRDVTIKSGQHKDILNPLQDVPEAQKDMLQDIVDAMHLRFKKLVAESRDLPLETVAEIADGRIFTAVDAMEHGLIDEIGYWYDAVDALRTLLDADDLIIYRYEEGFSWRQLLRGATSLRPAAWLENLQTPRLMYQWSID